MASSAEGALWEDYVQALSEIAAVPAASIRRESSITDDLGIDSLGIVELAVTLIERFKAVGMERALGDTDWSELTVGGAFDRYVVPAVREAERRTGITK